MSSLRSVGLSVTAWLVVFLVLSVTCLRQATACTALIAGKETTEDGSILYAKTEDDGPRDVDYLWFVDRQRAAEGEVLPLRAGGSLPQVPETYAFLWDQCPRTSYSSQVVNEWGVAMGSNACTSREDSVEQVQARGDLEAGGLGFMLRFLLAQRARTAREAVELAAGLLDEHGYSASGRNLNIVGPDEAWQLQMVRGKQYVARRVQDDEVVITANTYTIRHVDCADRRNFRCSPRLVEYSIERGWYDPATDGEFDFARAYAPDEARLAPSNTRRHWVIAKMIEPEFPLSWKEADEGRMPGSVKPARKISLTDAMAVMRSHFESTELDTSNGYATSPHRVDSRPVCDYSTHRTTVVQQRSWLPVEVGTVIWRALGPPCTSAFVPWHLGAREIPEVLRKAPESFYTAKRPLLEFHFEPPEPDQRLDRRSASTLFGVLGGLVDADYQAVHKYVRSRWSELERRAVKLQPAVDAAAIELHRRDPEAARAHLSQQGQAWVSESIAVATDLIDTLEWNLWGTGLGNEIRVAVEVDQEVLARYVGSYGVEAGPTFNVALAEGRLSLSVEGGGSYSLSAASDTEFFISAANIQLTFFVDDGGRVKKVLIKQGGTELVATPIASMSRCLGVRPGIEPC